MKNKSLSEKVLILGVDGLDPALTAQYLSEGKLPHIKQYIQRGACREDLSMLGAMPTVTPPMWTTMATGAYPMTHGITCFYRQSPQSLDTKEYNLTSRNCRAEQLWNVFAEAGKKTLVWHWPGSSWPPTSDSENLSVVDGTQPAAVNMGVAVVDWESIGLATEEMTEVLFQAHDAPSNNGAHR